MSHLSLSGWSQFLPKEFVVSPTTAGNDQLTRVPSAQPPLSHRAKHVSDVALQSLSVREHDERPVNSQNAPLVIGQDSQPRHIVQASITAILQSKKIPVNSRKLKRKFYQKKWRAVFAISAGRRFLRVSDFRELKRAETPPFLPVPRIST